jgi:hypothetical protein
MAINPTTDSSGSFGAIPRMAHGMAFKDVGSSGLKQSGGYVREEFLRDLAGREAVRVYREMSDNSAVIGAMLFSITQSMRKIDWRSEPASDKPEAKKEAEFADTLRTDMSHTWEDFIAEALSMLTYGYAPHEVVYKRRAGFKQEGSKFPTSTYDDGRIGWRRLPLRGQDTVTKWFFDENGSAKGLTQQPWNGPLIDIPIEKLLLFRPTMHKNNPEGRSILRSAYRAYYMQTRLEDQEAVLFERMNGLPVMRVPLQLMEDAAGDPDLPSTAYAVAAINEYKRIVTNVRIDEQMGLLIPSDCYEGQNGAPSNTPMYSFELLAPQSGKLSIDADKSIERYKLDQLMTVLADFIQVGHGQRGTQSLAISKVDMFFQAIEGWLVGIAAVLNRYALPRVWTLNNLNRDLMPHYVPDLAQRIDLDSLGNYILHLAQAGSQWFPDDDLENWLRDAAGMPDVSDERAFTPQAVSALGSEGLKKIFMGSIAKRVKELRNNK